jgi:hypothetical protein
VVRLDAYMLGEAGDTAWPLAIGSLVIVGIFVVGGVLISWVRRRFHPASRRQDGSLAGGFSLERLDVMRRSGEISDEEFRSLRRAALGLDAGAAKSPNCASSAPQGAVDDELGAGTEAPGAGEDAKKE